MKSIGFLVHLMKPLSKLALNFSLLNANLMSAVAAFIDDLSILWIVGTFFFVDIMVTSHGLFLKFCNFLKLLQ